MSNMFFSKILCFKSDYIHAINIPFVGFPKNLLESSETAFMSLNPKTKQKKWLLLGKLTALGWLMLKETTIGIFILKHNMPPNNNLMWDFYSILKLMY